MNPFDQGPMRRASFLLLSLLLPAAAAHAQATAPARPPAEPGARTYLWEVTSFTSRAYLYGTVHAGKPSFYPLPEPVEKAFAESKVLVVEADVSNAEAMGKGAASMLLVPPERLDTVVPAPLYERFRKQLARFSIPEEQVKPFKPFLASTMLAFEEWGRLGYLPQFGVDLHLIQKARKEGKKIAEIEGAQMQTQLIDSLTPAQSLAAFEGTVWAMENGLTREQITGMVNAWQSGDPNLLLEVARRYNEAVPGSRDIEEKFIWSRHEAMLAKIDDYLLASRERHFIAVGALHLAGPKGLVELLRKRGYVVKQL